MKSPSILLHAALAGLVCLATPLAAAETTIYDDDFSGDVGTPLSGRAPNIVNTTGDTYIADAALELDGAGRVISTNGDGIASITLPTISAGDVITINVAMTTAGTEDNWIGIGFSPSATATLFSQGAAWAIVRGGPGQAARGRLHLHIFSGPGRGAFDQSFKSGAQPAQGGLLTLTYAVSTGKLTASLDNRTIFDEIISYGGQPATPAPLGDIQHVNLQWFKQGTPYAPPPGLVESLSVSISRDSEASANPQ